MLFLKGDLIPADELRKTVSQKVKKIMYTILSTFLTTQGLFTERRELPSTLVNIYQKFKDTMTGLNSLSTSRKEFNIYLCQS